MTHELETVYNKLEVIADLSGKKEKDKYIKKYSEEEIFKKVVCLALDFSFVYHLKKLPESQTQETQPVEVIIHAIEHLSKQKGCSSADAQHIANLAGNNRFVWEIINRVMNKDLRCGASVKSFKKYIPELPLHASMLCISDLDKTLKLVGGDATELLYSLKLDGVRVWVIVTENSIQYISRNGKEYSNFYCFNSQVEQLVEVLLSSTNLSVSFPIIFDGEVISKDKDFQKQMTQLRRHKDADDSIFHLSIFDLVLDDICQIERIQILQEINEIRLSNFENTHTDKTTNPLGLVIEKQNKNNNRIDIVEHKTAEECGIKTKLDILTYSNNLCEKGEEGIVVKTKHGLYERKRSNHWCKVKMFHTIDLHVVGWEKGTGRNSNRMGKLLCDFNGVPVKVGSGFSDKEREFFMENCPRLIEVQYQDITKDKSLRFPTFVRVREDI